MSIINAHQPTIGFNRFVLLLSKSWRGFCNELMASKAKFDLRLRGYLKGGRKDFEKYVAEALGDLLNNDSSAEEEQPWKVE